MLGFFVNLIILKKADLGQTYLKTLLYETDVVMVKVAYS